MPVQEIMARPEHGDTEVMIACKVDSSDDMPWWSGAGTAQTERVRNCMDLGMLVPSKPTHRD